MLKTVIQTLFSLRILKELTSLPIVMYPDIECILKPKDYHQVKTSKTIMMHKA